MTFLPIFLVLVSAFLHAGWNLLAHTRRDQQTLFLRVSILVGLLGAGPALLAEWRGPAFPPAVWGLLLLTGAFQGLYFFGLTRGYRSGDFTVVYPVARALPVLALALVDVARGHPPSLVGWAGMILVSVGCFVVPLDSLRGFTLSRYWNRTMLWVLLIAAGTVGYSTVDKIALEMLPQGPVFAARYSIWEAATTVPPLWLLLRWSGEPPALERGLAGWKWPAIAAIFIFGGYWLVLWAYQLSPYASYIVAMRQFSIVLGVALGARLFREPAGRLRLSAAMVIAVGIVCIVVGA